MRIITILVFFVLSAFPTHADTIASNPIVFVTMVPNPIDFGTLAATFGNHVPSPQQAYRGGDLWIRYSDGTLRNLTAAAGYGNTGFQGASSIAVRDPAVHWDGNKIIFSMLIGAPTQRYQLTNFKWQLYEITGIGAAETPVISKVPNQPAAYNNISPTYASDDSILFISDRPRDDSVLHTYPQRDEYESSPVNSGVWKLNPATGLVSLLDHAPSGDFNPFVDSFGRVIFTRWDHLQRDQQNVGGSMGAFNYESEASTLQTSSTAEVYPEPRSTQDPDYKSTLNLFTINQFFPWMMNQDGTGLETLNHIGRQEVGLYSERSFNNDPNVEEFYGQYTTGQNQNEFTIFLHIKENPLTAGTYFGTSCQEFGTHSGGQLLSINAAPGVNANDMIVTALTHPDTSGATDSPGPNHSGLYRDPLPLSNGNLFAVHTTNTRQDSNIGTSSNPLSRYGYRIKLLTKSGQYYQPSTPLTSGISKTLSFWDPDQMVSFSGEMWEMMPVEVKSRTRPLAPAAHLEAPEASILQSLNIAVADLQTYLIQQNLALIISRNLTARDRNDRQQPTNLRVAGTNTQTIPHTGKIYDISFLQILQGDLIRSYTSGNANGRRVLAQPLHSVQVGINLENNSGMPGTVQIGEDGSMAAFVPARRALSWHVVSSTKESVVKERYWVTFQPGEVRVCATCHGLNTTDQIGRTEPINPPAALTQLLSHWKNLPSPQPTVTPTAIPPVEPTATMPPEDTSYKLIVSGKPVLQGGKKFAVRVEGGASNSGLSLRIKVNSLTCAGARSISQSKLALSGTLPRINKTNFTFLLYRKGLKEVQASSRITVSRTKGRGLSGQTLCQAVLKSLR